MQFTRNLDQNDPNCVLNRLPNRVGIVTLTPTNFQS